MTLRFTCAPGREGSAYRMYFSGLAESDTFVTTAGVTYSILGVYRLSVRNAENGAWEDKGFLADYGEGAAAVSDTVEITRGTLAPDKADADGYWSVTLRLTVDLAQYQKLEGIYSNLLSEKTAAIHSVVLAPGEGA